MRLAQPQLRELSGGESQCRCTGFFVSEYHSVRSKKAITREWVSDDSITFKLLHFNAVRRDNLGYRSYFTRQG